MTEHEQALEKNLVAARRTATDRAYMLQAIIPMLGPKGRQVVALWNDKGVERVHFDWATNPMNMEGEDVAQLYLDFEEACENSVPLDFDDSEIEQVNIKDLVDGLSNSQQG